MKLRKIASIAIIVIMTTIFSLGGILTSIFQTANLNAIASIGASSTREDLFRNDGSYTVHKSEISQGDVFHFFGLDWKVVHVNGNIATFWMTTPYTTYEFNSVNSAGLTQTASNTWSNGYLKATYNSETIAESDIRAFLRTEAANIIDKSIYSSYADKVVSGYIEGSNETNRVTTIKYSTEVTPDGTKVKTGVYYAANGGLNDYTSSTQTMSVHYGLAGDRLWLPSAEEIKDGGIWGFTSANGNGFRNWDDATLSNAAWLRTPTLKSNRAQVVGISTAPGGDFNSLTNSQSLFYDYIDKDYGVRPAIHMNIADATGESYEGTNTNNPVDDNNEMLKIFFVAMCSLGVLGIIFVVIAVISKSRKEMV